MKVRHLAFAALGSALCFSFSANAQQVEFGDNSSDWANDNECDDPRFTGTGMTSTPLLDEDAYHDANDCRVAYNAGTLSLADPTGVNFGNNSSDWANDGECDDPRFVGANMASTLLDEDMGADAVDCRALFVTGSISLRGAKSDVYFGDNSSDWANDNECDDPRFVGNGMTQTPLLEADRGHDANDCQSAYDAGTIILK